jgi:glycosyltransferase involved in cell wall biosynthesis
LLSAPGDAAALARNVIRVLQDPALAERLVANAREESQRCSWLAVRGQWLEVYRALASGETKRAREFTPGSVDSPKLSAP